MIKISSSRFSSRLRAFAVDFFGRLVIFYAMSDRSQAIELAFSAARERYAELDVSAERAIEQLSQVAISLQCWQGDDVGGFENSGMALGGGLAVTGNYLGKARSAEELRADADLAMSLIPGRHRFNLHASYAETGGGKMERDELAPGHFRGWVDWAKARGIGLDFNPTYFSHPKAADGFTLSHRDDAVRKFWVRHGIACREIGAAMGRALGTACVTNFWIPDGLKDTPADRKGPRERLVRSLDEIFEKPLDPAENLDAVEGKLFGLGSESYVVGSHEFYLGYAITRRKLICIDSGHFHPTESVADKISAVMPYLDRMLLHVSRGVRWDSDHVVTLTDELRAIATELVRGDYLNRVHLGLDFFDASINRVAAWVIGARSLLKALLAAMLEPAEKLREFEAEGDYTSRLALLEECKTLPFGAVWDYYCLQKGVASEGRWMDEVRRYEREVLSKRNS